MIFRLFCKLGFDEDGNYNNEMIKRIDESTHASASSSSRRTHASSLFASSSSSPFLNDTPSLCAMCLRKQEIMLAKRSEYDIPLNDEDDSEPIQFHTIPNSTSSASSS